MLNRYFFISGFLSFFIYFSFIFFFLYYANSKKNIIKYNSSSKDIVIELDIVVNKEKNIQKKVTTKVIQKPKKTDIFKKTKSSSVKKKTNLKSLFAKVSVKGVKIDEKKVVNNVKGNEVVSRFKSKFTKRKKIKKVQLSKIVDVKQLNSSKKKVLTNSKGNFNKYYSKIHSILLNRWYQYPLFFAKDYLVKVKVEILPSGVFRYSIVSLSGNDEVDLAVKQFLENESTKLYPKPEDGKIKEFIINFKPERKR